MWDGCWHRSLMLLHHCGVKKRKLTDWSLSCNLSPLSWSAALFSSLVLNLIDWACVYPFWHLQGCDNFCFQKNVCDSFSRHNLSANLVDILKSTNFDPQWRCFSATKAERSARTSWLWTSWLFQSQLIDKCITLQCYWWGQNFYSAVSWNSYFWPN